jgi:outer membrane protein assembly factor BamB
MIKKRGALCLLIAITPLAVLHGQLSPGTVLWSYDVGRRIMSSPTVGQDGNVYLGSDTSFYAITNFSGAASNNWTYPAGLSLGLSAAVAADGTIYFADNGAKCTVHSLNRDGSELWSIPLQTNFDHAVNSQSTPAVAFDGTIYLITGGRLFAVSPSGAITWQFRIDDDGGPALSPVIASDGTVYCASYLSRTLYSLAADGTLRWSATLANQAAGSIAIGSDGNIYVAAGVLYAFSPQGTNLWTTSTDYGLNGPPVVGGGSSVYVSESGAHTLYCFGPLGALQWQAFQSISKAVPGTGAAIDAAERVHYCVSNSIVALSPQGQVLWTVFGGFDPLGFYYAATSPVIGPDGILYAALNTKVYAISTGTNGPAKSSWPMFQQNARHTGKIERPFLQQTKQRDDGNVEFQVYAQINQTQTVQASTDLVNWTGLTNVVVTNVPMSVVDLSATNFPSRFYRTVSQ